MMTPDQMIEVIRAHTDGKTVQFKSNETWIDCGSYLQPNFNEFTFRIKPEPKVPRDFWAARCKDHGSGWKIWEHRPAAGCHYCEIIHVREVLED